MKRDTDNLKRLIREFGFDAVEDLLLPQAFPSIRIETTRVSEKDLKIGQSKVGGRPDLPKTIDWITIPANDDFITPLPFIAQVDLAEVSQYDVNELLPKKGMLYFFADEIGGRVFYLANKSNLERKNYPEDLTPTPPLEIAEYRFEPCSVTFVPEVNFPVNIPNPFDNPNVEYPEGKTWQDFYNLVYAANYIGLKPPYTRYVNRLLGFPHDVGTDIQLDCQLEVDVGYFYNNTAEQIEAAEVKKDQWQLLLQMGADNNAGMTWGDFGKLCFFIRKQDLRSQKFDDVCVYSYSS